MMAPQMCALTRVAGNARPILIWGTTRIGESQLLDKTAPGQWSR
jgi:hypothetical protein